MELNLTLPQGNFILKNSAEKRILLLLQPVAENLNFHGLKKLLAEEKFTAPTEV